MASTRIGRSRQFVLIGKQRYSLTLATFQRRPLFTEPRIVDVALSQILRAAEACGFAILAYCFMPDHLHLLIQGITEDAKLPLFVKHAKQLSGFHGQRLAGRRLWQPGYFERRLRIDEWSESAIDYILNNPVRAGLARHASDYPFCGTLPRSPAA